MKIVTFISFILSAFNIINAHLQSYARHHKWVKVLGGIDPKPEDIKFLVSVQIRGWHVCGGAIINEKFILTAAHCVISKINNQFKDGPWRIVCGTNDVNVSDSSVIVVDVEKIFVPKSFHIPKTIKDSWNADIAVLRLKQSLNLTSNTRLKKLNLPTEPLSYANIKATIAGFGWDVYKKIESWGGSYYIHSMSGKAHQINVTILEYNECLQFSPTKLMSSELCARISEPNADESAGACSGDSGSPMLYNDDTVIGVMVRSEDPCDQNIQPAYYTKVSFYVDFIENAENDNTNNMRVIEM